MNRRRVIIAIACASILLIGLVAWLFHAPPDPVFNSKTLTAWVWLYLSEDERIKEDERINMGLGSPRPDTPQMIEAAEILTQNRTNAIPFLLRKIATRDSALVQFGDKLLSARWAVRMGITERWNDYARQAEKQRETGVCGFRMLGTNAASAVPDLIRIMNTDPDRDCRIYAWLALCAVDRNNPALKQPATRN